MNGNKVEYPKVNIQCPDCGVYLFDIGGIHACFKCGYEQPSVNPIIAFDNLHNAAMQPDKDWNG